MFEQDGFLSAEFLPALDTLRQRQLPWFILLNDANRLAMDLLSQLTPAQESKRELMIAALYGRAVQSFQAVVILSARGMAADARTVLRSLCETVILQAKNSKDDKFHQKMDERHDNHRRKYALALLQDNHAKLTAEQISGLRKTINSIEAQYAPLKPQDMNIEVIAKSINLLPLYNVVYRATSGDAAHANLDAVIRHIITDHEGEIWGYSSNRSGAILG